MPLFADDIQTSPGRQAGTGGTGGTGGTHRGLDEDTANTCPGPEAAAASADPDDRAGLCPSPRQLVLLEQWNALQSGFRRLTDEVLRDVETETGLTPSSFHVLWFLLTTPGNSAPMNQLASTLNFTTAVTSGVL